MGRPLRIFFFSDWRIQSLDLAEELIQSVAPVDVIVYGGDDVARFVPPPEVPATMTIAGRTYFPESFIPLDELGDVLLALSEQTGQKPRALWSRRGLTLRQVFALYRDLSPANNRLSAFAKYARFGVLGIIGNDCVPADRAVLHAPGVRDLHAAPTVIEGVGFLGIEGAIYDGTRNHIGFVLHAEAEVRKHLRRSLQRLGAVFSAVKLATTRDENGIQMSGPPPGGNESMWHSKTVPPLPDKYRQEAQRSGRGFAFPGGRWSTFFAAIVRVTTWIWSRLSMPSGPDSNSQKQAPPERLIIVSHTPPAGCRLDTGIRFGFDRLGSEALKDFVLEHQPALVLCGHCHSRGGKSALLGSTLVVNAASDDTNPRSARAALIELGESPIVTWLAPPRGVTGPDIGPKRAAILTSYGITQLEEILESPTVQAAIQFGPVRTARLRAYMRACAENTAVWSARPELPERLLFYDVETGLNMGGPFDSPQEPWMIAVSDGTEVKQWAVPEEDQKRRCAMYLEFLAYLHTHPEYTLCSWSGSNFDERAVEAGIARWDHRRLPVWSAVPTLDLLRAFKRCLVLPMTSWSLKEVATWCGFAYTADLDGFEVGLHYEEYRAFGEPLPLEEIARYNIEDVRALAFVVERLLRSLPASLAPGDLEGEG